MIIEIDSQITLKQISLEYAQELFNLVKSGENKELRYWCPDLKSTYCDLEATKLHINDANSKFAKDQSPDFLIFENNMLAGLISLSPLYENQKVSEIGYWLGDNFAGKGLISKSFPHILDYAKNTLKLSRVELSTSEPNIRSQKIPRRFGFEEVKVVKNAERLSGGMVDHILWSYAFQDT